ncbi:MAG: type II toxin-antitoxin system VapB family antitoxin [Alphaproteobacteria bacterium]
MAFHIRDERTDALVRELARLKGIGLTEAVREAVTAELAREHGKTPLRERLRAVAAPIAAYRDTGRDIGKAFFDELSGV